ncbi:hypothetical protein EA462_00910 [Natrarchaeobius halalkaliphilus]|uniref:Uncharacterized protein n=1 Tax=Natrarchaeobius halalkaliphilus TaxID=1679091 RepID=A0A3N6P4F5_9EURY|nr:hypothetical protein [Natrarchaeobius halalkaliphilus]RQG92819.1 hypothetical protein EA462_00910 [Natrarchaeobius halalkaliphilus]
MSDTQQQQEFEKTDPSREIGVDPEKHPLYKELENNPNSPFYEEELVDIWLFTVGYGRQHSEREPLPGNKKWMLRMTSLDDDEEWIVKSIAIEETGTTDVLQDGKQIFTIAQEYANSGIELVHEEVTDTDSDSISELTSDVVRTHRSQNE